MVLHVYFMDCFKSDRRMHSRQKRPFCFGLLLFGLYTKSFNWDYISLYCKTKLLKNGTKRNEVWLEKKMS